MNNLIISFSVLILALFSPNNKKNQQNSGLLPEVSVCHSLADMGMEAFAADPVFQSLHPSPEAFEYIAKGQKISFKTSDGTSANGYFLKANKKSNKWLFVYQEWWGLNDYIRQQSDQFFEDLGGKVNILALDMYDGKVTADPKEAGTIMQSVKEDRLETIVKGAQSYAGKKAKIANVGWCFGGGWSLKSAILLGKQNAGSVMYYGMPVKDLAKLKLLNTDVLGLFATENYISKTIIEEFASNMKTADKKLEYKIFDAVHGFANPSNPKHDKLASEQANTMALNYIKNHLKI